MRHCLILPSALAARSMGPHVACIYIYANHMCWAALDGMALAAGAVAATCMQSNMLYIYVYFHTSPPICHELPSDLDINVLAAHDSPTYIMHI